jgi:hypothetical protein
MTMAMAEASAKPSAISTIAATIAPSTVPIVIETTVFVWPMRDPGQPEAKASRLASHPYTP